MEPGRLKYCTNYVWVIHIVNPTLLYVLSYFYKNSTLLNSRRWIKYFLLCWNVSTIQGFVIWQALSKTGIQVIMHVKLYFMGQCLETVLRLYLLSIGSEVFYFLRIFSASSYNSGGSCYKRKLYNTNVGHCSGNPCLHNKVGNHREQNPMHYS